MKGLLFVLENFIVFTIMTVIISSALYFFRDKFVFEDKENES